MSLGLSFLGLHKRATEAFSLWIGMVSLYSTMGKLKQETSEPEYWTVQRNAAEVSH